MFNAILPRSPDAKIAANTQTPKTERKTRNFSFERRVSSLYMRLRRIYMKNSITGIAAIAALLLTQGCSSVVKSGETSSQENTTAQMDRDGHSNNNHGGHSNEQMHHDGHSNNHQSDKSTITEAKLIPILKNRTTHSS
ncbi:MAG: hypothetical protein N2235_12645 [Fischerella sp.]|nr:hypothetical protein [Fischerella sp.]